MGVRSTLRGDLHSGPVLVCASHPPPLLDLLPWPRRLHHDARIPRLVPRRVRRRLRAARQARRLHVPHGQGQGVGHGALRAGLAEVRVPPCWAGGVCRGGPWGWCTHRTVRPLSRRASGTPRHVPRASRPPHVPRSTVWDSMSITKSSVTAGSAWLQAMADAAAGLNLTIQYCMPYPRHVLESTKFQVRGSKPLGLKRAQSGRPDHFPASPLPRTDDTSKSRTRARQVTTTLARATSTFRRRHCSTGRSASRRARMTCVERVPAGPPCRHAVSRSIVG